MHVLKSVMVIIMATTLPLTSTFAAGLGGEFSHGYRLGQVTKFSVKGIVNKSGEGQMLIGRESTPFCFPADKETGAQKCLNPWEILG